MTDSAGHRGEMEEVRLTDVDAVLSKAVGREIESYELNDEGLHIWLDDGGCLVFFGSFAVAAVPSEGLQ